MSMLLALVSGVVIHARFFRDLFTLRLFRGGNVAKLDTHTVTGVLTLPFCFLIALSGLIIFLVFHFPRAESSAAYADDEAHSVSLTHAGDVNGYVQVRRLRHRSIDLNIDVIRFASTNCNILHKHTAAPVVHVQRWFAGFHFIQFDHWTLRWLYFLGGLGGCAVIATVFDYWLGKRANKQAGACHWLGDGDRRGDVYLFRGQPAAAVRRKFRGLRASRAGGQVYLVWLANFAHARLCPRSAWLEQCLAIAALALAAPLLNWISTGHHPLVTLPQSGWGSAVLGMDALLLLAGVVVVVAARRCSRAGLPPEIGRSLPPDGSFARSKDGKNT